jgi:hypothetical protein
MSLFAHCTHLTYGFITLATLMLIQEVYTSYTVLSEHDLEVLDTLRISSSTLTTPTSSESLFYYCCFAFLYLDYPAFYCV